MICHDQSDLKRSCDQLEDLNSQETLRNDNNRASFLPNQHGNVEIFIQEEERL